MHRLTVKDQVILLKTTVILRPLYSSVDYRLPLNLESFLIIYSLSPIIVKSPLSGKKLPLFHLHGALETKCNASKGLLNVSSSHGLDERRVERTNNVFNNVFNRREKWKRSRKTVSLIIDVVGMVRIAEELFMISFASSPNRLLFCHPMP
jgi:hypothetical protein